MVIRPYYFAETGETSEGAKIFGVFNTKGRLMCETNRRQYAKRIAYALEVLNQVNVETNTELQNETV